MMTPLKESSASVITEIKIGAEPIGEIYIDSTKEMLTTVMIKKTFFGASGTTGNIGARHCSIPKDTVLKWYNY